MARGRIVFNEELCKGCGLCVEFCPRDCIVVTGELIGPSGYTLPSVAQPDKCNGCGICGWMCPDFAIEVYRREEAETRA